MSELRQKHKTGLLQPTNLFISTFYIATAVTLNLHYEIYTYIALYALVCYLIIVTTIKQIQICKRGGSLTCLGSDCGDGVQIGLDVSLFKLHGQFKGRLGQNVDSIWVSSSLHQLLSHSHLKKKNTHNILIETCHTEMAPQHTQHELSVHLVQLSNYPAIH